MVDLAGMADEYSERAKYWEVINQTLRSYLAICALAEIPLGLPEVPESVPVELPTDFWSRQYQFVTGVLSRVKEVQAIENVQNTQLGVITGSDALFELEQKITVLLLECSFHLSEGVLS